MDILADLPSTFIGAFLGTLAAFLSERLLRVRDATAVQVAALNNLVTDLHLRRALSANAAPQRIPAGESDDRRFATEAVIQIRTGIREARLSLRPGSSAEFQILVSMSSACNRYLENVQYGPEDYQYELELLRGTLSDAVGTLCETKGIQVREPGAGALETPPVTGHMASNN